MLPRLNSDDFKIIARYLGALVAFTGALMLVPLALSLAMGLKDIACDFAIGAGVCMVCGNAPRFLAMRVRRLARRQALVIVAFAWLVISLFAAIPLALSGDYLTFADAFFDAVSMSTTTGISLAQDLDHSALPMTLWRVIVSVMGGQGVILVVIALGFFGRNGGPASVFGADDDQQLLPDLAGMLRMIFAVCGAVTAFGTLVGALVCAGIGIPLAKAFFYGLTLAATAYSTGGITAHASGLVYFHSWEIEFFCVALALAGALNFVIYSGSRKGRGLLYGTEMKTYLLWLFLGVGASVFVMSLDGVLASFPELVRRGLFNSVLASATSGLQTVYPEQMGVAVSENVLLIIAMLAIVGGSCCSACGGIKALRLGIIGKWIAMTARRAVMPPSAAASAHYSHFHKAQLSNRIATFAMMVFILYAFTAMLGGIAGIAYGYGGVTSLFQSISAVSNCGMSTAIISPDMPLGLKAVYMAEMYLGRLEFIALFAAAVVGLVSLRPGRRARRRAADNVRRGTAPRRGRHVPEHGRAARGVSIAVAFVLAASVSLCLSPRQAMSATGGQAVPVSQDASALESVVQPVEMSIPDMLKVQDPDASFQVAFTGEAIGEPIDADEGYCWVNVGSDGKLIGVYMTEEQASMIDAWGAYGIKGSELEISGLLTNAHEDYGGELEVEADSVNMLSRGESSLPQPSDLKVKAAAAAFGAGLVLWLVYALRKRAIRK